MQRAFGVDVPDTVAEMCRPGAAAVLVYDAQVGVLPAPHREDRRTLLAQPRDDRRADAARPAGHDAPPSVQPEVHPGIMTACPGD